MASGVKVADQVKDIYNEMKVVKQDANQKDRIRLVVFHIKDGYIDVDRLYRERDLEGVDDVFKYFLSLMDPKRCCYFLYDCHYEIKDSKKEDLVFVMWAPEDAAIKDKMCHASSKDALKKILSGIKHELQINDISDFNRETFVEKIGKGITKLEGKAV